MIDELCEAGRSGSKVRNIVMPLQAIYRYELKRGLAVNPTTGLSLPPPGAERERAATPAEAAELLEALTEDRALWATGFYAGLRRGEIRALRVSDINFADGCTVITVTHGWDDLEGEILTKNRKPRKAPIGANLRDLLIAHKLATGRDGDDFLFGSTAARVRRPPPTCSRRRPRCASAAMAGPCCGTPARAPSRSTTCSQRAPKPAKRSYRLDGVTS